MALLHGFSDSADCWTPFAARFADAGALLAVDARGHGRSALPAGGAGPRQQADDHAEVLRELGGEPVVVLGHSMGGLTALALAARYPELVSAVIVEDSPLGPGRVAVRGVPEWLADLRSTDVAGRMAAGRAQNPTWPADELPPWARSKGELDLAFCGRTGDTAEPVTELVPHLRCPILLIAGAPDRGAMLSAAAIADTVRVARAPVTSAVIGTAGHNVRRDDREAFDTVVRRFLDGLYRAW
jgi:pimeloyl-ACP methyl ester carboxylesterase